MRQKTNKKIKNQPLINKKRKDNNQIQTHKALINQVSHPALPLTQTNKILVSITKIQEKSVSDIYNLITIVSLCEQRH